MKLRCCRRCRCGAYIVVRSCHTLLCIGIPMTLVYKETELRRSLLDYENLAFGISYVLLLLLSLVMYYTACCLDPGYVPVKEKKHGINDTSDEDEEEEENEGGENCKMLKERKDKHYRICDYCDIQQPMRSKHCDDCKRCVRRYDHHCPWLESCIGERNHKYFWMFLLLTSCVIIWSFCIAWQGVVFRTGWKDWLTINAILFIDLITLVLSGFVINGLLCFHTYLMAKNITTWESVCRERITYLKYLDDDFNPWDDGCIQNMLYFLCTFRVRKWEIMYARKAIVDEKDVV